MTETLEKLKQIKQSHDRCNRIFTLSIVIIFCLLGLVFWWQDLPLPDRLKSLVGFFIMFMAFVVYKIPYGVYHFNRWRFKQDPDCLRLMGSWQQYKKNIV